ncbi:predicted protein [Uncinocarpus reesii 1704]|uniref:Peptidase S8/S53 domain-containing protein n=1 Tax=Uncinocarpus reesii (strain UAMH 1704) TaxID=336963 RepID=C4JM81_UNCRE|nr:uncharacterized protein UREG_03939 [Uncinocarpus reesii 1704]EEP79093.1 predicted protein [Uncinocarpus reesii 1704]
MAIAGCLPTISTDGPVACETQVSDVHPWPCDFNVLGVVLTVSSLWCSALLVLESGQPTAEKPPLSTGITTLARVNRNKSVGTEITVQRVIFNKNSQAYSRSSENSNVSDPFPSSREQQHCVFASLGNWATAQASNQSRTHGCSAKLSSLSIDDDDGMASQWDTLSYASTSSQATELNTILLISIDTPATMAIISINGNELNPEDQAPVLRALHLESEDASKSDYILVQTTAPLSDEQENQLEQLGVVIHEYVSQNTYLCGYKDSDLAQIRALDFVAWANVYLDTFVIQPTLKSATPTAQSMSIFPTVRPTSKVREVDVIFHHDVDTQSESLKTAIATAARVDPDGLDISSSKVRLAVQEQYLEDLAALDHVRLIQRAYPAKLFNNIAVKLIDGEVELNGTAYEGEGQVVAVGDTGLDKGSMQDVHHAFKGRVKKLYPLGRASLGKADDPDGHGTHVCGSVLGDGESQTMGGRIRGVAVKSSLVVQSLLDSRGGLGGIPDDLTNLFLQPYKEDDAKIHTNSWGSNSSGQLPYDASSSEIDKFVWEHPDAVILFAAGNDGADVNRDGVIDEKQIGSQAAAKNCITVGASENNRPNLPVKYGRRWPAPPFGTDLMANNPEGMAAFSSRGPTKEGRIKPDVVAPGTGILSARSRNLLNPSEPYGRSDDPNYWFLAGTSMATPLVAGAVAVLRESVIKNGTSNPSAALIKALLINGTVKLAGQYVPSEAGPSPNPSSGFGLVNVKNSIILKDDKYAKYYEKSINRRQGLDEDDSITVDIPEAGAEASTGVKNMLKVTLVWSDPPGETLQNDLDLIVVASNGKERHGNMGEKPGFDRANNVEQVVWTNIPAGKVEIRVRAHRLATKTRAQPYALVWSFNRFNSFVRENMKNAKRKGQIGSGLLRIVYVYE